MSLYLRKRVKIAPGVALNLSKSGLGLSAGPKGLKVCAGPRGVQINAGRGPVRYRKSLGSGSKRQAASLGRPAPPAVAEHNSVALSEAGRQPGAAHWPTKSRAPLIRLSTAQLWGLAASAVLILVLISAVH